MTKEEQCIRTDRMRYTKNTASSALALCAIAFDVLYFINIYRSDVSTWYYSILTGASIIYNLLFMLAAFLCSEGVKSYKPGYARFLPLLGVGQLVRIFILPAKAHAAVASVEGVERVVMETAQYTRCIVWLTLSAVCCFAAGAVGIARCRHLAAYTASREAG